MLLLLAILLDGLVTLVLGIVIGTAWKISPLFYVSLAALHGLMAGACILFYLAVRALERDTAVSEEETADRSQRKPKVVPIFARPTLDKAA
jgi:small neutral amino acid transporter SnatA (MarC family)